MPLLSRLHIPVRRANSWESNTTAYSLLVNGVSPTTQLHFVLLAKHKLCVESDGLG